MRESQIAKRAIIDDLKEKFERCASFVIIDYKGLTVEKDTEFRAEFRKANVEYKVLKNTLVRIALNELGYKDFDAALNGPTAIAISYDDAIAPAKVVSEGRDKYNCDMIVANNLKQDGAGFGENSRQTGSLRNVGKRAQRSHTGSRNRPQCSCGKTKRLIA